MSLKKKVSDSILERSDSYQFYKNQYENQVLLNECIKILHEIQDLKMDLNQKHNDEISNLNEELNSLKVELNQKQDEKISNLNEELNSLKVELNQNQKYEIFNLNEELNSLKVEFNRKQDEEIFNLNEELKQLKKEVNHQKNINNKCLDSYNYLFNNIFLDYELKPKKLLNNIHLLTNELLDFITNVCKKYDLCFWLDYGNLLGAVRHGDYIPWDDDADIGMIRKDFLKFEKIIEKEIEDHNLDEFLKLTYKTRKIDDSMVNTFITIRIYYKMKSFPQKRIICNVDIFPYDFINDYEEKGFSQLCLESRNNLYRNKIKKINQKDYMEQYYKELNLSFEKTDHLIPGVDGACGIGYVYNMFILDTDRIFPLKEIEFGNNVFPCPNDVNYYLNSIYGDYMSIPKIIHRHNGMSKFRYNQDNDEMFEKCISMLKSANENF